MISEVTMPSLFENMIEGTLGSWHKNEGDPVNEGELLASIITEKAAIDLFAETSGVLLKILSKENSIVPVGQKIALVGKNGAGAEQIIAYQVKRDVKKNGTMLPSSKKVRATPGAKALAAEHQIDLSLVQSLAKIITEKDVLVHLG